MDSKNVSKQETKIEDVRSGPNAMDRRILVLLVVVVILLLSNIVTAYMALVDDDEHDDDEDHSNGKEPEARTPVIEDISVENAFILVQSMEGNTSFTVIDVRTTEEYDEGHIPDALNFNINGDSFNTTIGILDRNLSYLVYCKSGGRSGNARNMMIDMGFMEIYNMIGGFSGWRDAGYEYNAAQAAVREQNLTNLSAYDSYNVTQKNVNNSQFVILDVRTPGEYADGHLKNSINLDFWNVSFEDTLAILDRNLTYLIYSGSGLLSGMARDIMQSLGFWELINMIGGFDDWKKEGLPYRMS